MDLEALVAVAAEKVTAEGILFDCCSESLVCVLASGWDLYQFLAGVVKCYPRCSSMLLLFVVRVDGE